MTTRDSKEKPLSTTTNGIAATPRRDYGGNFGLEEGDRVAVLIRDRGRHRDSDAEVELLAGSVWTVRAGKLARVEFYANRADLFAASGFSPPEPPTAWG